jgi:cysteine desulfurase/selenocysteine lyase
MVDRVEFGGAKFRPTPARFEAGTPAIIESAGLHAALDFVDSVGLEKIAAHSSALAEYAAEKLRSLPGVRVFGPKSSRAHLVTFTVEGVHAHDLAFFCNDRRVAIRAGHHCAQPLMRKLGAPASARASFHFYNTPAEADRLVDAIAEAIRFFNP